MKNIIFLSFILLSTFTSCKKTSEEIIPESTNTISYDNKTYPLKNGYFIDYGADFDAYNLFFVLSDHVFGDSTNVDDFHVYITIDAYSPYTDFKTGTFKIDPNLFSENAIDEVYATIDDEELAIESGTVKILGNSPNFTIILDAITQDNKKITGSFKTTFIQKDNLYNFDKGTNYGFVIKKKVRTNLPI